MIVSPQRPYRSLKCKVFDTHQLLYPIVHKEYILAMNLAALKFCICDSTLKDIIGCQPHFTGKINAGHLNLQPGNE